MARLKPFLQAASRHLLNILFPRTCAVCREDVGPDDPGSLCRECWYQIPRWPGLICETCGVPLPDGGAHCYVCRREKRQFHLCRSVGVYEGVLKNCLLQLKYQGRDYLAGTLGPLLGEGAELWPALREVDGVVPVPLHFWRRQMRGYNQADLLARTFCREAGLALFPRVLIRRRATRSQTELKREQRFENMRDAFAVQRPDLVKGKKWLLVDDVCTTGATLEACAAALRAAGAKRVYALTVARQM